MNVRSILTINVPTAAVGAILLVLSAASLACAIAACYGVPDPLLARVPAAQAAPPLALIPRADAPAAQPMAGIVEPARCNAGPGSRARRGHGSVCRLADLPPV